VVIIGLRIGVANGTTEQCKITRSGMAIGALIPLVFMRSAVNWEIHIIVVKGCRCPGRLTVAILAACREPSRCMVGIVCLVVVCLVATHTGIRRVIIITIMASRAIVGYGRVRAVERIVIVVNGETRRRPAGGRRVAILATR